MEKELALVHPISNCYQFEAFPLSIIETHLPSYEWIFSNFVQTCFDLNSHISPVPFYFYIFDFTICPFLEALKMNRDFIRFNSLDILSCVENAIDNDFYVYLSLDEFYVPLRNPFGVRHFAHDALIHGFDSGNRELYLYGFTTNQHLEKTAISYDLFEQSYTNVASIADAQTAVNLYRLKKMLITH